MLVIRVNISLGMKKFLCVLVQILQFFSSIFFNIIRRFFFEYPVQDIIDCNIVFVNFFYGRSNLIGITAFFQFVILRQFILFIKNIIVRALYICRTGIIIINPRLLMFLFRYQNILGLLDSFPGILFWKRSNLGTLVIILQFV